MLFRFGGPPIRNEGKKNRAPAAGLAAGAFLFGAQGGVLPVRRGGRPGLTLLPELLEYETDGTEREALRAARHAKGDCP